MISYEEFLNLNNSDKFDYFMKICDEAKGTHLRAYQRKDYLKKLDMEDYNYWESSKKEFDFKSEYEKIVKLNDIAQKRIDSERKAREEESKRRKVIIELQNKLGTKVIYSKYDGYDKATGDIINVGDIIYYNKEVDGWCLVK